MVSIAICWRPRLHKGGPFMGRRGGRSCITRSPSVARLDDLRAIEMLLRIEPQSVLCSVACEQDLPSYLGTCIPSPRPSPSTAETTPFVRPANLPSRQGCLLQTERSKLISTHRCSSLRAVSGLVANERMKTCCERARDESMDRSISSEFRSLVAN